ncbi:Ribonucleotide reductase of class III (anaerobic), large subunit [Lachnospiraceae bacterium TWA4]|nr:Ribonucleotide reductase of class III (anaerobic), large subunit [Lachnospiraceae bacterium TWA4]
MKVIKKDGTHEEFQGQKIVNAVKKSASRVMIELNDSQYQEIVTRVQSVINNFDSVTVLDIHHIVEQVLDELHPKIAKSYRDYRNYKKDFVHMMDKVFQTSQSIRFIGDKENSNTDSTLVATKRCLIFNDLNKRLYRKFFMTQDELQACKDGYIYIHDQSARLDTINCCLCDVGAIMKGGFEMGNIWYNEPKTLDTAFDVLGDIILSTASQQYGGFTVPEIDKILEPYARKSYKMYLDEYDDINTYRYPTNCRADEYATRKVKRDFEQGFQGIEMKLNTVGSSRGDYPFITMTFGLATSIFGKMASITFLEVHTKGQGKEGNKKPVLFPKLVFLYDENLHGEGKQGTCPTYSHGVSLGQKDLKLMKNLFNAGTEHRKYMRMVCVWVNINAPLYWWKEFDTYKVGTVANSCSTMHKIHAKEFVPEDFSIELLDDVSKTYFNGLISYLNFYRDKYNETGDKEFWNQMIQLLPTSYNQKRTVMLNYEVVTRIIEQRKHHKLNEWHQLIAEFRKLPYMDSLI